MPAIEAGSVWGSTNSAYLAAHFPQRAALFLGDVCTLFAWLTAWLMETGGLGRDWLTTTKKPAELTPFIGDNSAGGCEGWEGLDSLS